MVMPITSAQTVAQIQSYPQLTAACAHLFMGEGCADTTIDQFCRNNPSWVKEDMLFGLNRLLEVADAEEAYVHPIWPGESGAKEKISLIHFPVSGEAPFVLVCAGGAYCTVASMVEAFPIAAKLNELGYHAFVLEYRSGKNARFPAPMEDLRQAILYIQQNAQMLHVKPDDFAVCGMSAGGHLVATLAAKSMQDFYAAIPMPAALFLAYPVVTMGKYPHSLTRGTLLGQDPDEAIVEKLSIEKQIHKHSPPVFLWQCREDAVVPFPNSLMLDGALEQNGVRHCFRIFEGNAHGWALGTGTQAEGWLEEAVRFWQTK